MELGWKKRVGIAVKFPQGHSGELRLYPGPHILFYLFF